MNRSSTRTKRLTILATCAFVGLGACAHPSAVPGGSSDPQPDEQTGQSVVEGVANPVSQTSWAIRQFQVMRSVDGMTWYDVTPPGLATVDGWHVVNDSEAMIAQVLSNGQIEVFLTDDGGASWKTAEVKVDGDIAGGQGSVFLAMADEANGLMTVQTSHGASMADVLVYSTTDGGANWTGLGHAPLLGPISFSTLTTAWAPGGAAGQELYRSDDAGVSWTSVGLPLPTSGEFSTVGVPHFFEDFAAELAIQGTTLLSFQSSDGGESWSLDAATLSDEGAYGGSAGLLPFDVVDPDHWFVGFQGMLYATTDGGKSWGTAPLPVPSPVQGIDVSGVNGVAVVGQASCSKDKDTCISTSTVVFTADGGLSWRVANPPPFTGDN